MRAAMQRYWWGDSSRGQAAWSVDSQCADYHNESAWDDKLTTEAFFRRNSRSFSFAACWFTRDQRQLVESLYAFCRTTDDIVDKKQPGIGTEAADEARRALDQWMMRCRNAYEGHPSELSWLDTLMTATKASGLPFDFVNELAIGVRMDLGPVAIRTLDELNLYAYRVASVVGIWLCYLFNIRDRDVLQRAAAMGRAMQLTNILRDVGEDLRRDRIYLPEEMMVCYDVSRCDLESIADNKSVPPKYEALIRAMMEVADAEYEYALPGLAALPGSFARASVVAAEVYRGIHREIRRNGFDNLNRRAHTGLMTKLALACYGLCRLRRIRFSAAKGSLLQEPVAPNLLRPIPSGRILDKTIPQTIRQSA